MPWAIRAPSKAGPAAVEVAVSWPSAARDNFAIGTNVDQERRRRATGQSGGQDSAHDVAAHERPYDRQYVNAAAGMDAQTAFNGRYGQPLLDSRNERHLAQRPGIDAAKKLLHRGVAGQCHFVDLLPANARGITQLADHGIDGLSRRPDVVAPGRQPGFEPKESASTRRRRSGFGD